MASSPLYKKEKLNLLLTHLFHKSEDRIQKIKVGILRRNNEIHAIGSPTKTYYKGQYYSFWSNGIPSKRIPLDPSLEKEMDAYIQDQEDYNIEYHFLSAYFTKALNVIDEVKHLYDLFPTNLQEDMPMHWFPVNYNINQASAAIAVAEFKDSTSEYTQQHITNRLLTNFIPSK